MSWRAKANRFPALETSEEKYRLPVHPPRAKTALDWTAELVSFFFSCEVWRDAQVWALVTKSVISESGCPPPTSNPVAVVTVTLCRVSCSFYRNKEGGTHK